MTDQDKPASEQFDLTMGQEFDISIEQVQEVANALKQTESLETGQEGTEWLAEWVEALKEIENAAEDARKEVFESELSNRVDTGETVRNLRKTPGSNTYVTDHEGAFDAVLESGEDPRKVAKVSASKLSDVLGEQADEYIGTSEYSYFRRQA